MTLDENFEMLYIFDSSLNFLCVVLDIFKVQPHAIKSLTTRNERRVENSWNRFSISFTWAIPKNPRNSQPISFFLKNVRFSVKSFSLWNFIPHLFFVLQHFHVNNSLIYLRRFYISHLLFCSLTSFCFALKIEFSNSVSRARSEFSWSISSCRLASLSRCNSIKRSRCFSDSFAASYTITNWRVRWKKEEWKNF